MVLSPEILDATCRANTLSMLITALRKWGVDPEPILANVDLTSRDLDDAECRISVSRFRDVWDAAFDVTGDDALGLHVIDTFDPAAVLADVVFYMATSSATPREAFNRVSPFIQLSHEAIEIDLSESDGHTICKVGYRGLSDQRTLTEYLVGLVAKIAPSVVGPEQTFKACFEFPPPQYAAEYASILGIEVEFEAPHNAFGGRRGKPGSAATERGCDSVFDDGAPGHRSACATSETLEFRGNRANADRGGSAVRRRDRRRSRPFVGPEWPNASPETGEVRRHLPGSTRRGPL